MKTIVTCPDPIEEEPDARLRFIIYYPTIVAIAFLLLLVMH